MKTGMLLKLQSLTRQKRWRMETVKLNLGEAAFYGPKLDFMIKGCSGKKMAIGNNPGGL